MAVRHILKDGTEVADITGIVIRQSEFPTLYNTINSINRKINMEEDYEKPQRRKQKAQTGS